MGQRVDHGLARRRDGFFRAAAGILRDRGELDDAGFLRTPALE